MCECSGSKHVCKTRSVKESSLCKERGKQNDRRTLQKPQYEDVFGAKVVTKAAHKGIHAGVVFCHKQKQNKLNYR